MSQLLYPAPRPQSTGEVLDSGFRIFQATLLSCLPYSLLCVLSGQLPHIYQIATGQPVSQPADAVTWVLYGLGALAALVFWGAIILRQRAVVLRQRPSARTELGTSLRKLLPFAAIVLVVAILFGGAGLLLVNGGSLWPAGAALLLVAVYLAIALSVSGHVLLLDDLGAIAGMGRSLRLVARNWWRTLLILLITLTIVLVFYVLAMVLAFFAVSVSGGMNVAVMTAASGFAFIALGAVVSPFGCAVVLAVLGDLRARREGSDLEHRLAGATQD